MLPDTSHHTDPHVPVSWAFSEYHNAGDWPAYGFTRSGWPPVPDVRNDWIIWPAMTQKKVRYGRRGCGRAGGPAGKGF